MPALPAPTTQMSASIRRAGALSRRTMRVAVLMGVGEAIAPVLFSTCWVTF
jgi:hypothetical protein